MPNKPKSETMLVNKSEYWRLRAEVLALRDLLGTTYAHSLGFHDVESEESKQMHEDFEKAFRDLAAAHFSKILCEIEDISPRLAADLDDRTLDETDPI